MTRLTLALAAVATLTACHSKPQYLPSGDLAPATDKDYAKGGIYDVTFDSIKGNPSPELMGMNERPMDVERNLAVNGNQTSRMFWSDLGRMWFADEPSPLSPYPTVNTSGNP
jgi:predicted small lipoprotein YifL